MQTELGKELARLRKKAGLSQSELARQTGIAQTTISQYERGERTPKIGKLSILLNFFGVNFGELPKGAILDVSEQFGNEINEQLQQLAPQLEKYNADDMGFDLRDAINSAYSYNGKPITDQDKKIMLGLLDGYLDNKDD